MARPLKTGLDYFPLDVVLDDNIELIEAEHGIQGFAILIKLWQKIYANGYFIEWDNDNIMLFSKRNTIDVKIINSVVNSCIERGVFDSKIYKKHLVLTSYAIQKRYLIACSTGRRKKVLLNPELTLLTPDLIKLYNDLIEFTNEESAQSKVKERKVKESNIGTLSLTERQQLFYDELKDYIEKYSKEMLRAFYDYWSEPNQTKTKMRREMEKTWDTGRRLSVWRRLDRSTPIQEVNLRPPQTMLHINNTDDEFKKLLKEAEEFALKLENQ